MSRRFYALTEKGELMHFPTKAQRDGFCRSDNVDPHAEMMLGIIRYLPAWTPIPASHPQAREYRRWHKEQWGE